MVQHFAAPRDGIYWRRSIKIVTHLLRKGGGGAMAPASRPCHGTLIDKSTSAAVGPAGSHHGPVVAKGTVGFFCRNQFLRPCATSFNAVFLAGFSSKQIETGGSAISIGFGAAPAQPPGIGDADATHGTIPSSMLRMVSRGTACLPEHRFGDQHP